MSERESGGVANQVNLDFALDFLFPSSHTRRLKSDFQSPFSRTEGLRLPSVPSEKRRDGQQLEAALTLWRLENLPPPFTRWTLAGCLAAASNLRWAEILAFFHLALH